MYRVFGFSLHSYTISTYFIFIHRVIYLMIVIVDVIVAATLLVVFREYVLFSRYLLNIYSLRMCVFPFLIFFLVCLFEFFSSLLILYLISWLLRFLLCFVSFKIVNAAIAMFGGKLINPLTY